jgi:hypothetical protein
MTGRIQKYYSASSGQPVETLEGGAFDFGAAHGVLRLRVCRAVQTCELGPEDGPVAGGGAGQSERRSLAGRR